MNAEDRVEVQEWWTALGREHRRRHDRVRHGHRQGRRALRLPLQPAEGPRVVLAGDRPRRPRRRAVDLRALRLPRRRADARELRVRRHADAARRSQACSRSVFAHAPGEQFAVSEYDLSSRHDVRPLVLKTILTYLELDGLLEQGTPFYAGYSVRPAGGALDDVLAGFDADRADFLRRVVASGKAGRIWTSVDPDAVPGEQRERVVKALGYLEERGLVELKVADVRQRFTLLRAAAVARRAARPPRRALRPPRAVRDGADRASRRARRPRRLPGAVARRLLRRDPRRAVRPLHVLPDRIRPAPSGAGCDARRSSCDRAALDELASEHPAALGTPRQRARFLCGLTSPATTKAKLSRHALFGALAEQRFADVLARA